MARRVKELRAATIFPLIVYMRRRKMGCQKQAKVLNVLPLKIEEGQHMQKFFPETLRRIENWYPDYAKQVVMAKSDKELLVDIASMHNESVVKQLYQACLSTRNYKTLVVT